MVLMNAPEVLDLLNGNLKLMHCAKHWIKSDSLYDGYFQDISSTIIQGIYLFFISYMKFCAKDMDFLLYYMLFLLQNEENTSKSIINFIWLNL